MLGYLDTHVFLLDILMVNYYHKLLLKWGYSPLRTSSISSLIVRQHDHHTNHRQNIAKKSKSHEEKTNIFSLSKRKGVHYKWWRHYHKKKKKKRGGSSFRSVVLDLVSPALNLDLASLALETTSLIVKASSERLALVSG